MKIGVMFGNPETTTGGNALKFYASVRLDIRRIGQIKEREEVVGNQTRVKVVKNKVAPPFKQVEFDIMYGEGISKEGDLLDLGANSGIIEKSGTWYSYKDERIGQGRDAARAFLKGRPELVTEIRKLVLEKSGIGVKPKTAAETAAENAKTLPPPTTASTKTSASSSDVAAAKAKAMAAASKAAQATSKK
jgi:recombination protein RecA